jgi:DNA-binding NtrC family response regulator
VSAHVLVVDDEPNLRKVLGALLEGAGHATSRAASAREAFDLVRAQDPDLVITDLRMPEVDGMELLSWMRRDFPEIPVIVLTAHGSIGLAVEAMRCGAHDFLTKPFEKERVLATVAAALAQGELQRADAQGGFGDRDDLGMTGNSASMDRLRSLVRRVAPTPATILIVGETGTGKELVAEALHRLSPRAKGPLVRVNCGALPENLVESELFGFEKGAFSGADRAKPGRFELADGGTLFLDEIGELPLPAQVKLLRVLQDGRVDALGGTAPRQVDVRLVAATHRDLGTLVREGRFREDLLFRLRVVELRLPPLRERTEDVPELLDLFLDRQAQRLRRRRPSVSPAAIARLQSHGWPGNVRELEHAVERAVLLSDATVLEPHDFGLASDGAPMQEGRTALADATGEAERRVMRQALEAHGGNVTHAAQALGLSRRGLQLKMKALGLRDPPPS